MPLFRQPSSSLVEKPRSPLNVELSSCGRIFSLPKLTRGKGGNLITIIVMKVVGSRLVCQLPISLPVLKRIMESSAKLTITQYQCCQFQAMFSTAFYAFLCIGKMTPNLSRNSDVPLQVHQLVKLEILKIFTTCRGL